MNDAVDQSIIAAEHVALRYMFVLPARWNAEGMAGSADDLTLEQVHAHLERSDVAARYVEPLSSFYADVTIPFTTRRQLPVATLVDPANTAREIIYIEIGAIETSWGGDPITVPPVVVPATFADAVAFFDSGQVVYSPAFVLHPAQARGAPFTSQHLSALTSLLGSPGASYRLGLSSLRSKIRFWRSGDSAGVDLAAFVHRRVGMISAAQSRSNVYADLIRPVLDGSSRSRSRRDTARAELATLGWNDLRSASIEIVGATRYEEVADWCRSAQPGNKSVGPAQRALAALGQNVIDVHNQDEHEVADSLAQAVVTNDHILLIHPILVVRYSRRSRSFTEMHGLIGGCPYMMLTNMVVTYNEFLLDQSAKLVDGAKKVVRRRWTDARGSSSLKVALSDLGARVQLFENQTLNVLPNIFRYPAEKTMFDEIVKQRGLAQRASGIERFTRNLYELREDFIHLSERMGTRRTNGLLMGLGILQVSGLFLTLLTVDDVRTASISAHGYLWGAFAVSLAFGVGVVAAAFIRR